MKFASFCGNGLRFFLKDKTQIDSKDNRNFILLFFGIYPVNVIKKNDFKTPDII